MKEDNTVEMLLSAAKAVGYGQIPPFQHDECFTVGAFDLILSDCTDREHIFRLLEAICQRYSHVRADPEFLSGYLYLLGQLAHCSNTTELPAGMKQILQENPDSTAELRRWYRVKG